MGTVAENFSLLFYFKIVYFYVIEVDDTESYTALHDKSLIFVLFAFFRTMHLVDQDVVIMYTLVRS